ncbi:hypothetical protein AF79_10935 [Aliarcobacter butzleri L354]|nr:hypothetical protein AF79_10935 [Aliarcobacter butzleri L354]
MDYLQSLVMEHLQIGIDQNQLLQIGHIGLLKIKTILQMLNIILIMI